MIRLTTYAAFATAALIASGAARAPAQIPGDRPLVGVSLASSMPIAAVVAGIDPNGETVTLVLPGGTTSTQKVSSGSAQNLRQLKVGEVVNVTYKERLTFIVSEPNAKTPPPQEAVAAMAAYHPQKELGALAAQDVRNFYVIAADPATKTLSVVDSNGGAVRTLAVDDPYAQAQLPLMKPGYKLTVIGVQAVIVAIEKRAGTSDGLALNNPQPR
jgi:hypothetical protein